MSLGQASAVTEPAPTHILDSPLKRWKNDVQVVNDDRDPTPVNWEEVVKISEESARGLDLSQDSRDVIVELQIQHRPDPQELNHGFISS